MKRIACLPIVALLLTLSVAISAADAPDRPPGVAAASWVPVSERLGIVLVNRASSVPIAANDKVLLLKPPVGGYFMVKGAAGWTRLVIVEPPKGPADVG